MRNWICYL